MKLLFLLPLVFGFSLISCKKEPDPIWGCMDSDAINYNSEATNNNSLCEYQSKPTTWIHKNTHALFYNGSSYRMDIYINDELQIETSFNTNVGLTSAPSCGTDDDGNNVYSFWTYDLGIKKTENFIIDLRNENGFDVVTKLITLNANECQVIQIN